MKRKSSQFVLVLALAFALGMGLAACSPPAIMGGGASGSSPTLENSSAQASTDEAEAEKTAADFDPATCLEGSWLISNEFFLAAIREFGDEIKTTEGEVVTTFAADGTMTTEYRGWLITAIVESHTVTIQRDGTDTGTFSAAEDTVDLIETQMGSVLVLSGPGPAMTVPAEPMHYTSAPYTCDQSSATINTIDGAAQLARL